MAWNICVDLTLACLPQTLVVSLSSDSPRTCPFVPTVLFTYEGASPGVGTLPLLQFLQGHRYHPIFSFIFSPFISLSFTQLHEDFFLSLRCPRSSARVQQVLWKNCSACRCTLDVPVGRDELHMLLLFCPDQVSFSFTLYFCSCGVTTIIIIFFCLFVDNPYIELKRKISKKCSKYFTVISLLQTS